MAQYVPRSGGGRGGGGGGGAAAAAADMILMTRRTDADATTPRMRCCRPATAPPHKNSSTYTLAACNTRCLADDAGATL
jgi:hypothetical protein